MNREVQQIIESTDAVPSVPHIVTRLLDVTNDPNYKQADVVRLLATDAGVASDILRMANSSLFGGMNQTSTLHDAITRLGVRRVRTLVISRAMIVGLNATPLRGIDASYYWRRSLACAVLSAHLATRLKLALRDHAFVGGLLCDVGVAVLARAIPTQYAPLAAAYAPHAGASLTQQELDTIHVTHADIGAAALERWQLPKELVSAVRIHHSAASSDTSAVAQLARVMGAASEIARKLCEASQASEAAAVCCAAVESIGLASVDLGEILQNVQTEIDEISVILHVDVISSKVYRIIASELASTLAAAAGA